MPNFGVLLRKELQEQWRTFRLPIVVIVFLIFGLLSPLTAKFTPELLKLLGNGIEIKLPIPTAKDAIDQLLKNLGQFGPLAAILLTMGSVAGEKERGTAALVMTKPVSRWAFLAAKFTALAVTLGAGVFAAGIAAYFYTTLLFEALPIGGYLVGCLLLLVVILVFVAITLLGSTLVNSAIAAGAIGIAAWIGLGIVSAIPKVGDFVPTTLFAPAGQLSLGLNVTNLVAPLLVSIGLIGLCIGAAWLSFRRQEL